MVFERFLSLEKEGRSVVLRADVQDLGADRQISRALKALDKEGKIMRFGYGLFGLAKRSQFGGNIVSKAGVSKVVPEIMDCLGVVVSPSVATLRYNLGKTTQVPARCVFDIGRQRISRKIKVGNQTIRFENNNPLKKQKLVAA